MNGISDRVTKLKKRSEKLHQKKMNAEIAAAGTYSFEYYYTPPRYVSSMNRKF